MVCIHEMFLKHLGPGLYAVITLIMFEIPEYPHFYEKHGKLLFEEIT